ncbi:MAG: RDD family protein [Solirubrobacterales bacterium]
MNDAFFAAPSNELNAPAWELSGWWRRAGAYIIDSLLIGIPAIFLSELFASGTAGTAETGTGEDFAIEGGAVLFVFVITAIYYMWTMTAWNGQTVGKKVTGIRVVRENGESITPGYAFVRQSLVIGVLFGWIALILLYIPTILNYLWPLWDQKNQALHDKIVNSRVVLAHEVSNPGIAVPPAPVAPAGQPTYGYTPPFPQEPAAQPPAPQAPAPPPPPAPPTPDGTSTPYTPPPGFENPVPDDDK